MGPSVTGGLRTVHVTPRPDRRPIVGSEINGASSPAGRTGNVSHMMTADRVASALQYVREQSDTARRRRAFATTPGSVLTEQVGPPAAGQAVR